MGSYFSPDIEAVAACDPDLIIAAPSHEEVIRHFNNSDCKLMVMEARKLENAFSHMEMIGRLFDCEPRVAAVIRRNRDQLALVKARLVALLDLDIGSSYTPWDFRATGTGTDNVLVVQGEGPVERFTGGHTKTGELIARAVHAGVTEAIARQNGIKADRDLFQRLADRKLSLEQVTEQYSVKADKKVLVTKLENVLMVPYYASFLESALAISDDYEKGLIKELTFFDTMCHSVTARAWQAGEMSLLWPLVHPIP